MIIKLVAFDWNGTILADTSAIVKADNAVLQHFGFPQTSLKEVQDDYRMPIRDFWAAMGVDLKIYGV